jgi:EAL domain-containing protein (putative c-di-GMP-specific phosphodiesterase class I)
MAGLGLEWLTVEVKEDLVVEGVDPVVHAGLLDMRRRGARIALDDFGSGMANLGHLRRFEVDEIKIARALVQEIGTDRHADAIVHGVIGFSNGMEAAISANGVETEHQLEFLKEAGCDVVQGLLFAPAMPIAEVDRWVAGLNLPRKKIG